MKISMVYVSAVLVLASAAQAQAAACSGAVARQIIAQGLALQGPGNACARELKRRNIDVSRMCRVCGPFAVRYTRFERYVRQHSECFRTSRDRRLVRQLASARPAANFIRRGCGY